MDSRQRIHGCQGGFQVFIVQYVTGGPGPRFGLIVHHTDADREYAYDRDSHVGKLDKALDEAKTNGWIVVSMKDDWRTIFPATGRSGHHE